MVVKERKIFLTGLVGLGTFFVAMPFWLFPVLGQRTGLERADGLFNQLAKSSAYCIPAALKKAAQFEGVLVDVGVDPRWPGGDEMVFKIFAANGVSARIVGDGRVRMSGDLGLLSKAAVLDASLLFKGKEQDLREKYGMSGMEALYFWWAAFDDLTRRYIQLNRSTEADFTKYIATRVLEPAYNFAGIEPKNISENAGAAALLLVFYIGYTLWYGFSILYLFEGVGIRAIKQVEKKES